MYNTYDHTSMAFTLDMINGNEENITPHFIYIRPQIQNFKLTWQHWDTHILSASYTQPSLYEFRCTCLVIFREETAKECIKFSLLPESITKAHTCCILFLYEISSFIPWFPLFCKMSGACTSFSCLVSLHSPCKKNVYTPFCPLSVLGTLGYFMANPSMTPYLQHIIGHPSPCLWPFRCFLALPWSWF